MKKIKLKYLISVSLVICLICGLTLNLKVKASTKYQVDKNVEYLMKDINKLAEDREGVTYSSNPYDYISNNENYNNIINQGIEALPIIIDDINNSSNNGLREYILSIAVEDIICVESNKEKYWSNAKEWLDEWKKDMRNIKTQVSYIASNEEVTLKEKKSALKKLGVMALPYIKDEINNGKTTLIEAYDEIVSNIKNDTSTFSLNKSTQNNMYIDTYDEEIIRNIIESVSE